MKGEDIKISFARTVPNETDWEPFNFNCNERGILLPLPPI
jgi:hypothetical protein